MNTLDSPHGHPNARFNISASQAHTFQETLNELEATRDVLRKHGIRLAGGNRLETYIRSIRLALSLLDARGQTTRAKAPSREVLHQIPLDGRQLALAARQLSQPPEISGWRARMQVAIGGTSFPQTDQDSRARNMQFELFLAASLRQAGYDVQFAEPDLVVNPGNLSIAAKRVRSPAKLERNIREGGSQVARASTRGLVAVDLSALVNPTNQAIEISDPKAATQMLAAVTAQFQDLFARRLLNLVRSPPVVAILVYVAALAIQRAPPQMHTASRLHLYGLCEDDLIGNLALRHMLAQIGRGFGASISAV